MRVLDFVEGVVRCGLLADDDCIEKAAQAERDWQRPVSQAHWPAVHSIAYSPAPRTRDEL
jgi:hypothetical protein